ncbi:MULTISPECIES: MFS transporter [Actinomadura]|uniref:MFS transporter n=1 Tax=Actinomadura miaoliensis TaxID=430685 RepID=A0ABP7WII4_9ACTN
MTTASPAPPASPGGVAASVAARIERLPTSRWHLKVRTLIGVVTFFEAFDQLLIASALPVISREWHLSGLQQTLTVTGGSVGMLVGALVAGRLADRIGRVRMVVLCVALTALSSLGIVFAPGFAVFLLLRFVQGLGIGGEVPVAATYINEIARAGHRGRFVLLYELVFPAGLMAASVLATWVVPNMGWRAMFAIGALPALLVVLLQRRVPESPRWLAARGRDADAERTMRRIEDEVERATGRPLPAPADPAAFTAAAPRGSLRDLFTGIYLRRTTVISVLWFCGYFVNYSISSWLPTIYTKVYEVPLGTALKYNQLSTVAGFLGCLCAALLVDRLGRRAVIGGGLAGSAVVLAVLALLGATSGAQVALFASIASAFNFAANISLYLYTPELYPTRNRALGVAFGGSWNRIGVILGPTITGALIGAGAGIAGVFLILAVVALVGMAATYFAVETRGKTLEELNP